MKHLWQAYHEGVANVGFGYTETPQVNWLTIDRAIEYGYSSSAEGPDSLKLTKFKLAVPGKLV